MTCRYLQCLLYVKHKILLLFFLFFCLFCILSAGSLILQIDSPDFLQKSQFIEGIIATVRLIEQSFEQHFGSGIKVTADEQCGFPAQQKVAETYCINCFLNPFFHTACHLGEQCVDDSHSPKVIAVDKAVDKSLGISHPIEPENEVEVEVGLVVLLQLAIGKAYAIAHLIEMFTCCGRHFLVSILRQSESVFQPRKCFDIALRQEKLPTAIDGVAHLRIEAFAENALVG